MINSLKLSTLIYLTARAYFYENVTTLIWWLLILKLFWTDDHIVSVTAVKWLTLIKNGRVCDTIFVESSVFCLYFSCFIDWPNTKTVLIKLSHELTLLRFDFICHANRYRSLYHLLIYTFKIFSLIGLKFTNLLRSKLKQTGFH